MHRLKGELLLRQDDSNNRRSSALLQRAMRLRASRALSRGNCERRRVSRGCSNQQGRRDEARLMLAEIYGCLPRL